MQIFFKKSIFIPEKKFITREEQTTILNEIGIRPKNVSLSQKWEHSIKRNPDIYFFLKLDEVTCFIEYKCYAYIPLATVDVERSFSKIVRIQCNRRRNMPVASMVSYLSILHNKL